MVINTKELLGPKAEGASDISNWKDPTEPEDSTSKKGWSSKLVEIVIGWFMGYL